MNQPCGCCAGIESITPQSEANRPGLNAISYRVGTHATFLETMLARLSNLFLEVATDGGDSQRIYPLKDSKTRDPGDPSIALLDCWATVADVLAFYQERVANEGFLRTATERMSVLELARLVGYELRPGVAASVHLAFTVADGFQGDLPAGTRAQSIPGPGELPQFFETSEKLATRDTWNELEPRLTRPQVITLADDNEGLPVDSGTDARTRDTLYFQGVSTNLKPSDALLIVLGDGEGQQVLRFVEAVDVQPEQERTEVTLQEPIPVAMGTAAVVDVLQTFIDEASSIFAGSSLAGDVAELLIQIRESLGSDGAQSAAQSIIPQIEEKHDLAVKRKFTRLAPWLARLLETLNSLAEQPSDPGTSTMSAVVAGAPQSGSAASKSISPSSPLGNLNAILEKLAAPRSVQPANAARLERSVARTFSPQSDIAPRFLGAFQPAAAPLLYKAWSGIDAIRSQVEVYALRVKASVFGHNSLGKALLESEPQSDSRLKFIGYQDWPIIEDVPLSHPSTKRVSHESDDTIYLDGVFDQIQRNSWIVVRTESSRITSERLLCTNAVEVKSVSRTVYGISGKATQITLRSPSDRWLSVDPMKIGASNPAVDDDFEAIRRTIVYAQPELLDLAEEPLDTDVEGDAIELDDLYEGLESGRWIIISGERTDIPKVSGVKANELAMIAAVTQGARAPLCAPFPADLTPFSRVLYATEPNSLGDRLVVGVLGVDIERIKSLPDPQFPNQQYCDQIQLAPGVFANAYVPTDLERGGDFTDFDGVSAHPDTGAPLVVSQEPTIGEVYAWRISSAKTHTILTLANKLAYAYDASTVSIYANVAKATHGQTVPEILGNGDASQTFQKFGLSHSPLTHVSAPTAAGTDGTLVVRVNDVEWHEEDSLAGLGPSDRSYITRTDDAGKTTVVFGNGVHGARLPTGAANINAAYRYGIGKAGNVKAERISQLATRPLGAQEVINPLPATGGADRDGRDQARRNTPVAVLALDRLVSVQDYADFARTFAGIDKASAARLSDGFRELVHLTIAGAGDIPIDWSSDLYRNLVQALHRLGNPYQSIQVAVRKVKLLVISAAVRLLPDYEWESVEPKVRGALLDAFGFERREIGQSAFLSEAVAVVQSIEGVSYVDVDVFDSVAEDATPEELATLAETLMLNAFVEATPAWLDTSVDLATADDPSQRIVAAELVYLTPDIPDTLILTEIGR